VQDHPFLSSKTGNPDFDRSMRKAEADMENAMAKSAKGFDAAMVMAFTVETRVWFFIELLALSIPVGLRIREMVVAEQPASFPFQPKPLLEKGKGLDSLINRR